MADINWKSKYTELKAKYMSAVDAAFRIGMEQGMQQAQIQQAQDQAAQQQAQEQAMAQGQGQPGQEGAPQEGDEQQQPDSAHPQGSELDQHISTLEGMLGKSEMTEEDMKVIRKSIESIKFGMEMKKSDLAVRGIAKALQPAPTAMKKAAQFALSKNAQVNLNPTAKAALSMQAQIVANVMAGFEEQEKSMSKSIADIVAGEGLKKD